MNSPRSPRKPAKLFASPYHRHAFGSVELADVAWPKPPSDEARARALAPAPSEGESFTSSRDDDSFNSFRARRRTGVGDLGRARVCAL